ncbi:MAG: TetR-like C-terminal domain-containing protein [Ornithinibacter sp.]
MRAPAADDLEDQQASAEVVAVVVDVLAGFGLHGERAIDAARTVRSAVHGFVILESSSGFGRPRGLDTSFAFLIDTPAGSTSRHETQVVFVGAEGAFDGVAVSVAGGVERGGSTTAGAAGLAMGGLVGPGAVPGSGPGPRSCGAGRRPDPV